MGQIGLGQDPTQHIFTQFVIWYTKQQNGCGMTLNSINLNISDQIIFDSDITDQIFCNKDFLTNIDLTKNIKYILVANVMKIQINGIENYNIFSREIKIFYM
jgi:hypothetical protein